MASLFGISPADMQKKLVPSAEDANVSFVIGDEDGCMLSEADLLSVVEMEEDRLLSEIPDNYRALMRRVEGELAVKSAAEGQVNVRAGMFPVTADTLKVYVNYSSARAWIDRCDSDALAAGDFTLTPETGLIAITGGLRRGDSVALEYEHTAAMKMLWMKECAKSYTACEIALRFANFRTSDGIDRYLEWKNEVKDFLSRMAKQQRPGVDLIERVKLVNETRGVNIGKIFG